MNPRIYDRADFREILELTVDRTINTYNFPRERACSLVDFVLESFAAHLPRYLSDRRIATEVIERIGQEVAEEFGYTDHAATAFTRDILATLARLISQRTKP